MVSLTTQRLTPDPSSLFHFLIDNGLAPHFGFVLTAQHRERADDAVHAAQCLLQMAWLLFGFQLRSIENELMTPSMKLKRPQLQQRFQPQVGC